MAKDSYKPTDSDSEPIDWAKDDDATVVRKINCRSAEAQTLWSKKLKQYQRADAYLDGRPDRVDPNKDPMVYNPIFPIIRNMVGLTTDPRPHPSVKLGRVKKNTPKEVIQELVDLGDRLEKSLDDWWEDERMQSSLQRVVFGLYTYSDYFLMPYFDPEKGDVCVYELSPRRVKVDPNAERASDGDYVVVEFYRSKLQMYAQFGQEKCKDIKFADYREVRDFEREDGGEEDSETKVLKNVCKLELYMEKEWWVYKVGDVVLEKMRCPYWVPDVNTQKSERADAVRAKYEKGGITGAVSKAVDAVKGVVGMETDNDRMEQELSSVLDAFEPKNNYLGSPRLPIIHIETYRLPGETYSRSTMEQSVPTVDEINKRKGDISTNSRTLGKPAMLVDGNTYNENDARKIKMGITEGDTVRLQTSGQKTLRESVFIAQGTPVPTQFFEDLEDNKRELDTLWGHHEVSKGAGDPASRTKGGILALQEADQTPIRYVSRNIEDALQELFGWVVQIRKLHMKEELSVGDEYIDYSQVSDVLRVFVKSGSMLPVSKEQQRQQAIDLYGMSALDPLTLFERIGESDPEKTAKRLEAWLQTRQVLLDGQGDDQQNRVVDKLRLIQKNQFDKIAVAPDDDPKVHHDMLLMALRTNRFTPEQEKVMAELIAQYAQIAEQAPPGGAGQPAAPAAAEMGA